MIHDRHQSPQHSASPGRQRLDLTATGTRGSAPLPAPLIVAVILGLLLIGIPLYLWRKPPEAGAEFAEPAAESAPTPSAAEVLTSALASSRPLQTSSQAVSVRLSPFRTIRCVKAGAGKTPPERCDRLPFF